MLILCRLGTSRTKTLSYGTNKDVYCEVLQKTADFPGGRLADRLFLQGLKTWASTKAIEEVIKKWGYVTLF